MTGNVSLLCGDCGRKDGYPVWNYFDERQHWLASADGRSEMPEHLRCFWELQPPSKP